MNHEAKLVNAAIRDSLAVAPNGVLCRPPVSTSKAQDAIGALCDFVRTLARECKLNLVMPLVMIDGIPLYPSDLQDDVDVRTRLRERLYHANGLQESSHARETGSDQRAQHDPRAEGREGP